MCDFNVEFMSFTKNTNDITKDSIVLGKVIIFIFEHFQSERSIH